MVRNMSMKNDRTLSTLPPRKPLSSPTTTPTIEAMIAAVVAIVSDTRQP